MIESLKLLRQTVEITCMSLPILKCGLCQTGKSLNVSNLLSHIACIHSVFGQSRIGHSKYVDFKWAFFSIVGQALGIDGRLKWLNEKYS